MNLFIIFTIILQLSSTVWSKSLVRLIRSASISSSSKLWPQGIVYYTIKKGDFDAKDVDGITSAMKEIESATCIQFKERTNEKDYIKIYKGDKCSSKMGRRGGEQDLKLVKGSCINTRGKLMHELMHALGFFHEQQRSDRDQYLIINMKNVEKGKEKNFEINSEKDNILLTPFDYNSLMMYSSTSMAKDKKSPTMEAKDQNQQLISPGEKSLSELDIQGIKKLYKCP